MVHILLAAAGISVFFSMIDTHAEAHPFVEPMVIMSILLLNACIGVWQVCVGVGVGVGVCVCVYV
jgi:hypothetical protein